MKEFFTIKNIAILIGVIYVIVLAERFMQRDVKDSEILIEYQAEKIKMQNKILNLTNKIHNYENAIIQNSNYVTNMSSTERDSTRNLLNPR